MPAIERWLKRRRETGDVAGPKPIPGHPSVKSAVLGERLPKHLEENSDLMTLEEHSEAFEEARDVSASISAVG